MEDFCRTPEQAPYSVVSLVLGIASVVLGCALVGFVCGIIGLVYANKGMKEYNENPAS